MGTSLNFFEIEEEYFPAILTFVAVIITYIFVPKEISLKKNCIDALQKQSVEVEPGVRESVFVKGLNLETGFYENVETTFDILMRGLKISKDGPCVGHIDSSTNKYVWKSYSEVYTLAWRFGSALVAKGMKPSDTSRIGLYAYNCPEWIIVAHACSMFSMTLVPFNDNMNKEICTHIVNHTGVSLVICGNWMKAKFLMDKAEYTPNLNNIVIIDNVDFDLIIPSPPGTEQSTVSTQVVRIAKTLDVEIMSFEEMIHVGLRESHNPVLPKPGTICTIMFTSGTTGDPKGVVLTHKAIISSINAIGLIGHKCDWIPNKVVYLSYLSAAQSYERVNQLLILVNGGKIGFSSGDITRFFEEVVELRPTVLTAVPKILNHIHERVHKGVQKSGRLRWMIFRFAMWRKLRLLKRGEITRNTIWDLLLFDKVQKLMGGRLELLVSGAAALNEHVMDFVRATFGCHVHEGYGLTEVSGPATLTLPYEYQSGPVGPPLPNFRIKLVDVPELGLFVSKNIGEICIQGPALMKEYFKDPNRTAAAIDADGFMHTGDIGIWDYNGALRVVDRIKQMFKLAQGEFVSPEMIENVYKNSDFIFQVYVDGNSTMSRPVAIVVPSEGHLLMWVQRYLRKDLTFHEACKDPVVRETIIAEMMTQAKNAKLENYEQVKDIYLTDVPFTIENGLMTTSMKIRRSIMRKRFHEELSKLYKQ